MANYAYVENNELIEFYDILPNNWKNISGFNLISDENYLNDLGWYKIIKNQINYDSSCERIIKYEYYIENNKVYEKPIIEKFTSDSVDEYVPQEISATQIRLWLVKNNFPLSAIQDAIDSLEDEFMKSELNVRWEYAPYFERSNPFVDIIGLTIGLNSKQIDQAFIEASKM